MLASKIAVPVAAAALVTAAIPAHAAAAQSGGFVSIQHYFDANTRFTKYETGPVCVWVGREADGTVVYGWESQRQCGTAITAYGYDLDGDTRPEVHVWPENTFCGVRLRSWQWAERGNWQEYVTGDCIRTTSGQMEFVYNRYSTSNGATCASALQWLDQRYRAANQAYLNAVRNNSNRLTLKTLWHHVNRSELTLAACRRAMSAGVR